MQRIFSAWSFSARCCCVLDTAKEPTSGQKGNCQTQTKQNKQQKQRTKKTQNHNQTNKTTNNDKFFSTSLSQIIFVTQNLLVKVLSSSNRAKPNRNKKPRENRQICQPNIPLQSKATAAVRFVAPQSPTLSRPSHKLSLWPKIFSLRS